MGEITIGARIRAWRKYRRYSQRELAEAVGYDAASLSLIENGKRKCYVVLAEACAAALEVDLPEFWGEVPDGPEPPPTVER